MDKTAVNFEIFGCRIEFGWNSLRTLGQHAKRLDARKVLIVTDEGVFSCGIAEKVSLVLKKEHIDAVIFKDVSPNPTDENIRQGAKMYKQASCDLVVGVGGGSPMDAAKGIGVLACHDEPLCQYYGIEGQQNLVHPLPPLVAIPTTAGTGSEASRVSVITDTHMHTKRVLWPGPPTVSIVDPELMVGMPAFLTAATGMDALSHSIEAVLSPRFHPVAEAIAFEGIRLVAANLITAVEDGKNTTARTQMAMASTMGALAFQKGLGVAHSLAHPLSTAYGVHHGVANAIVLPYTMEFNREFAVEKLARIALAMGVKAPSPDAAVQAVADLVRKVGLPSKLSEVNIPSEGLAAMARDAMQDRCHLNNPRACTQASMQYLYQSAL